jgi:hypothetical protein
MNGLATAAQGSAIVESLPVLVILAVFVVFAFALYVIAINGAPAVMIDDPKTPTQSPHHQKPNPTPAVS